MNGRVEYLNILPFDEIAMLDTLPCDETYKQKRYIHHPLKFVKNINERIKKGVCPICGCQEQNYSGQMAQYPEVYSFSSCKNCGTILGYEDNSPWEDLCEELKLAKVRSKKKLLKIIQSFYCESNERQVKFYNTSRNNKFVSLND
jgi:hypothetical protein